MKKIIISILVILLISVSIYFFVYRTDINNKSAEVGKDSSCVTYEEEEIVRGNSMDPFIKNGQTVKILNGFYDCNKVQKGDVIIYDYAGNPEPLIKSVYAISGEELSLREDGDRWNILINGEMIKNRDGFKYRIKERGHRMLSLYKGVIPKNAYLILGEDISGSIDSTRFGLIGEQDILGKVEI